MADDLKENGVVYTDTPNLSQVKIGDTKYNIKDKAGREALDSEIEARIAGDAALATSISDEETRAKGEEAKKVDKVEGKSLISDSEITRLAGMSDGANKVEASTTNGNIKIDGTETTVYTLPSNVVKDADYKHITVTSSSVSDGTNTFNQYDDTELAGKVSTIESDYLKAADKTEVKGLITAEENRAKGVEGGLETRIQNLEARGRFLSSWNVGTGLPGDYPSIEKGAEYPYKAGDYYIVGSVPASGDKYQPDGTKITRDAEGKYNVPKKAESREVGVGDYYLYTSTGWIWIQNSEKTINFSSIAGNARDNGSLKGELEALESADTALSGRIAVYEGAKDGYDDAVAKKHEHSNKALLDTYTQTEANLADAVSKKHSHANQSELDLIESGDKAKWDSATGKAHEHSNKTILDGIGADNLLDAGQKTKLAGIEAGAEVNIIETVKVNGAALTPDENRAVNIDISGKVDKETGKRLMTNDEGTKLAGIAAGAQVNVIEKIKLNGTDLTPDSDKRIDLGSIATTEAVVAKVEYVDASHKLTQTKGSTTTDVHTFGDLADTNIAKIQAKGQSITGVTASYTPAGSVAVGHTATAIESTGSVTATGTVSKPNVNLTSAEKEFVTGLKGGSVASFTEGTFTPNTPTVIDTDKFSGGSKAADSFTANAPAKLNDGFYTAGSDASLTGGSVASLGDQSKSKFVKKAMNFTVGTGTDAECLIISEVATTDTNFYSDAVTDRGTFVANTLQSLSGGKAAVIDTTKFYGGSAAAFTEGTFTPAEIKTGFYTAGTAASKTADSFTANVLQGVNTDTVNNVTAAALAAAPEFTGNAVNVTVNGSYDKANAAATFTGTPGEAAVGTITVAAADIEKKSE